MLATLDIQGVQTPFQEAGTGEPVLFLHGVPDSGAMWAGVVRKIRPQYRCLVPDLPGLGRSIAPADFDYSLANRAQWIDDLLQTLKITEPITIVAHDHGGAFGITWAVQNPARVRTLVLTNTFFHSDLNWHYLAQLWRTPLIGEYLAWAQATPMGWLPFQLEVRRGSRGLSPQAVQTTYNQTTWRNNRQTLRLYRATPPQVFAPWEGAFYNLITQVPTLVLWGTRDPYIPVSFPRRLEKHGAKLIYFRKAGHWLPLERPEPFAEKMLAFMQEQC